MHPGKLRVIHHFFLLSLDVYLVPINDCNLYQFQDACLLGALEDGLNALLNIEVCAQRCSNQEQILERLWIDG